MPKFTVEIDCSSAAFWWGDEEDKLSFATTLLCRILEALAIDLARFENGNTQEYIRPLPPEGLA